jgi:hypothetical protein
MNAVERLHYFDGQRLEALDLRLEQRYHIELRRLLNRGLFAPGAINGLEVAAVDGHTVEVSAGLALDPLGREVVLASAQRLAVPNRPPVQASLGGYFLTVRYAEVPVPGSVDGCRAPLGVMQPSRVVEQPTLGWTETWPNHKLCGQSGNPEDCAIVLAKVDLDGACAIAGINAAARQWAQVIVPGQVHAFALEGGRDIDAQHPGILRFHVRGGRPSAVILYLWGEPFTPYYYSELGNHAHSTADGKTDPTAMPSHAHDFPSQQTTTGTPDTHSHDLQVSYPNSGWVLCTIDPTLGYPLIPPVTLSPAWGWGSYQRTGPPFVIRDGSHIHTLNATTTGGPAVGAADHDHGIKGGVGGSAGVTDAVARSNGAHAYTYVNNMVVKLDGHTITDLITGAPRNWTGLGDGTAGSPLAQLGTGPIDLIAAGLALEEGQHVLEFSVAVGGGRVAYNLYIE